MVTEALGTAPARLANLHAAGTAEDATAWLLIRAARHLDHVHEQFISAAETAASTLTRAASGTAPINSLGVLQHNGTQVDILAARRADAVEHLQQVTLVYQQVAALSDAAPQARRPGTSPNPPIAAPVRPPRGR
ncbi:hypothetical protein AB0I84_12480 [Streptomyces spectabilis]|uniref:hypothetical protein n=1 Tax=Streptomyces spectabilis TaxID=68270 RepID=UPI0033C8F804